VVSVTLEDGTPIVTGGVVVAGAPSVTVVTHNFTATGGDGYDMFARNPNRTRLPGTDTQAWREYLEHLGTIEADGVRYQPGGEGRIVFQAAPTPTPTATAPATPTATPTAIPPTPTRIVPRPPDTGTGTASGGNTGPVWLAVAGALALAGGAVALRRTRRS
jgi:LPXTG-motif cell wall-anchored protein